MLNLKKANFYFHCPLYESLLYNHPQSFNFTLQSSFNLIPDKAKVIFAPKDIFLAFGQPAILDCHFRSNPPLKFLRWEKDGFLFDPYNVRNVFSKRNGSLYFSEVDDLVAGKYTCKSSFKRNLGIFFSDGNLFRRMIWCTLGMILIILMKNL